MVKTFPLHVSRISETVILDIANAPPSLLVKLDDGVTITETSPLLIDIVVPELSK